MCKCVFKHTQRNGHVWVSLWMKSVTSQPDRAQFVHTDAWLCLKHFLIKRRWQALHIATPNSLPSPSRFCQVQTQQRSSNINTMEKVFCINKIIQRQKPREPSITTKGWSTQYLWKDTASGDGELVTLMCTSEAPATCCGESWVEPGYLLCCIGPCRHLSHRVNTVKHCTMPLRTARSRPHNRALRW